jgi:hypothetical protein
MRSAANATLIAVEIKFCGKCFHSRIVGQKRELIGSCVSERCGSIPPLRSDWLSSDLFCGTSIVDKAGLFQPLSFVEEQGSFNLNSNACYCETRSVQHVFSFVALSSVQYPILKPNSGS